MPASGPSTTFNGAEIRLFDSRKSADRGEPGCVISLDDGGAVIATADGSIRVIKVRADAGKLPAIEYSASAGLEVGSKLGT